MNNKSKFPIIGLLIGALLSYGVLAFGQSAGFWYPSANYLRPTVPTYGLQIPALANCNTIDTDANGKLSCGVDATGGGGGGNWTRTDGLVYPTTTTDSVLVGGSATSTTGYRFEVQGASLFDNIRSLGSTSTQSYTTIFGLNSEYFTDLTGTGLQNTAGVLTLNTAGAWTGNAGTASALAANGANCAAGQYPLGVDASGAVESCAAIPTGSFSTTTNDYWLSTKTTDNLTENTNLYYTDARARLSVSETITGIDYTSATGVFSITSGYGIPTTASTTQYWTAYTWGNHSLAGYLTSVASDSAWTTHNSYPSACSAGQYVSAIGDTLTCDTPSLSGGGSNWQFLSASVITPTSTVGIIVNASSTFQNELTVESYIISPIIYIGSDTAKGNFEWDYYTSAFNFINNETDLFEFSGNNDAYLSFEGLTGIRKYLFPDLTGTFLMATGTQSILTTGSATTTNLAATGLVSCDTIDTDASGNLICGTDATGASSFSTTTNDYWFNNTAGITGNTGITTLGTITTGVWNGTDIQDQYLATTYSTQAYASTTYVMAGNWTSINNYPTGCANQFIRAIGDTLTCATVDMSADTNLTALAPLTITLDRMDLLYGYGLGITATSTLRVLDMFVLNTGDVGTGVYDFGGATSFEIPNGSPTVDATGEIGIDTTSDYLTYYGASSARIINPLPEKCFTMASTTWNGSGLVNIPLWHPNKAITVVNAYCNADGGTSIIATLSDGTNNMDALTCDEDGAEDTSLSNNTWTSRERMEVDLSSLTGTVNYLNYCITFYYTAD